MKKVLVVLFLIICLIPSLGMIVLGPSKSGANEVLAAKPESGPEFFNQCADYIADRFAFRQELITAWSWINAKIFNTSVEDQVVLGKDGWLYYSSDFADELSDEELETIAVNIEAIQKCVEERGAKFVFTIAPDKSSLFAENLPDGYKTKNKNAERLREYLNAHNINYVNLFNLSIPYYKTDSHWTDCGAAVVADELLGTDYARASFYISGKHTGDLYQMLFPSLSNNEDRVEYAPGFSFTCEKDPRGGDAITINTVNPEKSGTLFCWRDSFGVSLYPYLAENFEKAEFSRSSDYDVLKTGDADYVILEIAERNLEKLL